MDFSAIKENARFGLKNNWGKAIVASIIAGAVGAGAQIPTNLEIDLSGYEGTPLEPFMTDVAEFVEQNADWLFTALGILAVLSLIMTVVMFILSSIISVGYAKFNLDIVDVKDVKLGTLFSYFRNWKNLILANLLSNIFVFLWSLLCIVPGIIAAYKYAAVPYILADDPYISPREALDRSETIIQGHKLELFSLSLSFIGWSFLCVLSCGIGFIWLTPYMAAAQAEFYREISGTRRMNYAPPTDSFIQSFTENN